MAASVTASNLHLYSLTLQPPSAVRDAVVGNFAGGGPKDQLLLTATGSRITLYKTAESLEDDRLKGTLVEIHSQDCFAVIRALGTYKIAGSSKEYLIVTADNGRITTLEWQSEKQCWQQNHLETFGQSGVRRAIPGEYLAVDPRGRACMIASIEKNKVIYFLNRDSKGNLTISSPLEAHKPRTITFALTALDNGYDNPVFAALELDYTDCDQDPTDQAMKDVEKELVYYELDLGLNHVMRKWSDAVDRTAHALYQVPGGRDGPGGVLVCGLDNITYRHDNQDIFRVAIPRRSGPLEDPDRERRIVAGVTPKAKGAFFVILQTDDGDLFRVSLDVKKDRNGVSTGEVSKLVIQYFATIPVASVIVLTKTAYLYCASESGQQCLYALMDLGEQNTAFDSDQFPVNWNDPYEPVYFDKPDVEPTLEWQRDFDKSNPTTASRVSELTHGEPPQIVSACGTGARSSLKVTKHGLPVFERSRGDLAGAEGIPTGVWTTKLKHADRYDSWVVMAYPNSTLTLQIDPENESIEEVSSQDARFLDRVQTIAVQVLVNDDVVQVHSRGVRVIKPARHCDDWEAPDVRTVVTAATNERQVAIGLSSGEIYYFELADDGTFAELEFHPEMPAPITALSLAEIPEGSRRSDFLAVGLADQTVRMLTCDQNGTLHQLSLQATSSPPTAMQILPMKDVSGRTTLFLHIGLRSGVYIRTVIDEQTAALTNSHTRFLGPRGVRFAVVTVAGQQVLLAMGARTFMIYPHPRDNTLKATPLDYSPLDFARRLNMENDSDGMVCLQGSTLCLLSVPSVASHLMTQTTPLQYTPRSLTQIPDTPHFIVLEADPNTMTPAVQKAIESQQSREASRAHRAIKKEEDADGDAAMDLDDRDEKMTGTEPPMEKKEYLLNPRTRGTWASLITLVDPLKQQILARIELDDNEHAIACCFATITSQDSDTFLFVSTAKNAPVVQHSTQCGYIHLYRLYDPGYYNPDWQQVSDPHFEFLHKTKFDAPPLALLPFHGRLLLGWGRHVCIYDVGMKQLLRKSWRPRACPYAVVALDTYGTRVYAADQKESITYLNYDPKTNELIPFADDIQPRWSTCCTMVDYETVAGGDKFGNVFVVRCPKEVSDEIDQENGGLVVKQLKPYLSGTPHRLELAAHFYVNDIPMGFHKTVLQPGGLEVLVWTGLQGSIGVVVPFAMQDDISMFHDLERCMRMAEPNILGRDHLLYRSYYVPVKGCIDGDLIERYFTLSNEWKQKIANEVEKSVQDVEKKIVEMRVRSAF